MKELQNEDEDTDGKLPKPDVSADLKDLPPIVGETVKNFDKLHDVLKKSSCKYFCS